MMSSPTPRVFDGATYTFEDDRFSYGEQRFVTLGLLAGVPVSVVQTENEHEIRIISFRKATLGRAMSVTSRNRAKSMRWTTRVTWFVTQPPHNTLFYGDRWVLMGVRSTGGKSLTVIIFIVIGRARSISGAASVNRRVVRLRSPGRFFGELRRGHAVASQRDPAALRSVGG
jgi:hypothetical protein